MLWAQAKVHLYVFEVDVSKIIWFCWSNLFTWKIKLNLLQWVLLDDMHNKIESMLYSLCPWLWLNLDPNLCLRTWICVQNNHEGLNKRCTSLKFSMGFLCRTKSNLIQTCNEVNFSRTNNSVPLIFST